MLVKWDDSIEAYVFKSTRFSHCQAHRSPMPTYSTDVNDAMFSLAKVLDKGHLIMPLPWDPKWNIIMFPSVSSLGWTIGRHPYVSSGKWQAHLMLLSPT